MEESSPEERRIILDGPFTDEQIQLIAGFTEQLGGRAVEAALDLPFQEVQPTPIVEKKLIGKGDFFTAAARYSSDPNPVGHIWGRLSRTPRQIRDDTSVSVITEDGTEMDFPFAENGRVDVNALGVYCYEVFKRLRTTLTINDFVRELPESMPSRIGKTSIPVLAGVIDDTIGIALPEKLTDMVPDFVTRNLSYEKRVNNRPKIPDPINLRVKEDTPYLEEGKITLASLEKFIEDFSDELNIDEDPKTASQRVFDGIIHYMQYVNSVMKLQKTFLYDDGIDFSVAHKIAYEYGSTNSRRKVQLNDAYRIYLLVGQVTEPDPEATMPVREQPTATP